MCSCVPERSYNGETAFQPKVRHFFPIMFVRHIRVLGGHTVQEQMQPMKRLSREGVCPKMSVKGLCPLVSWLGCGGLVPQAFQTSQALTFRQDEQSVGGLCPERR